MKTKHSFDMVAGTQEVFRLLLDAIANPGRPVDLSAQVNQFAANGSWLAPALTLMDNETGFYWDGLPEVGEEIRFLSGAAQVSLDKADFVFLSLPESSGGASGASNDEVSGASHDTVTEAAKILSQVKCGTHLNPHDSALLFVAAGGKPNQSLRFKGPGIPPEGREVLLSEAEVAWVKAWDAQGVEFPCGVELIFQREDNSLVAITRKAAVTWPM